MLQVVHKIAPLVQVFGTLEYFSIVLSEDVQKLNYHWLKTNVLHSIIRKSLYAFFAPDSYREGEWRNAKIKLKGEGFTPRKRH